MTIFQKSVASITIAFIALAISLFGYWNGYNSNKIKYSLDDIMTIYQHGYLTGELRALKGDKLTNWKNDSLEMVNRFKPLYK